MDEELIEREDALFQRLMPDGFELVVYRMVYNDRLCLGVPNDRFGYERGWCVPIGTGVAIAQVWDGHGDPPGFIKEVGTDRYGPGSPGGARLAGR